MTDANGSRSNTIVLVQALRGLAAMLVLVGHCQEQLATAAFKSGMAFLPHFVWPGGFGVDLFFCISGFIMVVTSARLAGQLGAAREFLARRAIRLVPLYWLATLLYLIVLAFGSQGLPAQPVTALVTSLVFWPFPAFGLQDGLAFPLLSLGWSLNYEVLFYLLFSIALVWPIERAVGATWALLVILVGAGMAFRPEGVALRFWTQAIVLEFGAGMLAGLVWRRGFRLSMPFALVLAALAIAWLCVDPAGLMRHPRGQSTPNDMVRLLGWGIPAIALLLALTTYERGQPERVRRWPIQPLVHLGDWSYALYLFHPFALVGLTRAWLKLDPSLRPGLPWLAAAFIVGSVMLAAFVHRKVDQPMTASLNRRWRKRRAWPLQPSK